MTAMTFNVSASPALWTAAEKGDLKGVQKAVTDGQNINAADGDRYTALLFAAAAGKVGVVRWLLANGADPNLANAQGQTPLMGASLKGEIAVVRALLEGGALSGIRDNNGRTALDYARRGGKAAVVVLLDGAPTESVPTLILPRPATETPLSGDLIRQFLSEQDQRETRLKEVDRKEAILLQQDTARQRAEQQRIEADRQRTEAIETAQRRGAQCQVDLSSCLAKCSEDTMGRDIGTTLGGIAGAALFGGRGLSSGILSGVMTQGYADNQGMRHSCDSACRSTYRCD